MKDIAIIGSGGFAREVAYLIDDINKQSEKKVWNLLGFVGDKEESVGNIVDGLEVICTDDELSDFQGSVAIGIGDPKIISKISKRISGYEGLEFPNLIHPSVIFDPNRVDMGRGNIICAGCIFTVNIKIGSFNVFNLGSTYGHDITVNDACVINPGVNISGSVSIMDSVLVGTGSCILQNLSIGSHSIVAAGALVNKHVPDSSMAIGVPAKIRSI